MSPVDRAKTLAELFMESGGSPVELGGRVIRLALDIPLAKSQNLVTVTREAARDDPVQGVCLRVKGGKLKVAGQVSPGVVLWADTAPQSTDVEVLQPPRAASVLRVWNCWRGKHDEVQAWIGNAGLIVEETGTDAYRLLGSDGPGDFDENSLVFSIRISS